MVLTILNVKDILNDICINKYKMTQVNNTMEYVKRVNGVIIRVSKADVLLDYPFVPKQCNHSEKMELLIINKKSLDIVKQKIKRLRKKKVSSSRKKKMNKLIKRKNKYISNIERQRKINKFYKKLYTDISTKLKENGFVSVNMSEGTCKYPKLIRAMTTRHIVIIEQQIR